MSRKSRRKRISQDNVIKRLQQELKPRVEPLGRCAYCGSLLWEESEYHWMYDEDGQRVRKCNDDSCCGRIRRRHNQEDSYRNAMTSFNRMGKGKWMEGNNEPRTVE